MKPLAETMRIRYLYRRKILSGEIRVDRHTAKRLIGPDCAFHLYGRHTESKVQRPKGKGTRRDK